MRIYVGAYMRTYTAWFPRRPLGLAEGSPDVAFFPFFLAGAIENDLK